jgi:predicted dehydrogenase
VLQTEIADNIRDSELSSTVPDIEDTILLDKATSDAQRLALLEKCLRNEARTVYGRCVFKIADNDVCDNQVVNMQFDNGSTATLTMIAFSKDTCVRKTKVYGTKGEVEWDDSRNPNQLVHYDFLTKKSNLVDCRLVSESDEELKKSERANKNIKLSGHSGTDYWLMHRFVEACLTRDQSLVLTDLEDSLKSHLIVFAAEHARRTNQVVDIEDFCRLNDIKI